MPKNVAFSKILHNGNQPKSVINRRVNVARLDRVADAEQLKARWAATECLRLASNQRVIIHRPQIDRPGFQRKYNSSKGKVPWLTTT